MEYQAFYNLIGQEAARIRAQLAPFSHTGNSIALQGMSEQLISELSDISARVLLLEQLAEANLLSQDAFAHGPLLKASLSLTVSDLFDADMCWPIEEVGAGEHLTWMKRSQWYKSLPMLRVKPLLAKLKVKHTIKHEYLKQLSILVDGVKLKHKVSRVNDAFILCFIIPESESFGVSTIEVQLPQVHSPASLKQGEDPRELGLALQELTTAPASFSQRLMLKL